MCSYGRSFNPTVRYLGRQLAALEGGEAAYCCASGMAAISATLLALCNSGDHIVCSNAVYGGAFALMKASGGWRCQWRWCWCEEGPKHGHQNMPVRARQLAPPLPVDNSPFARPRLLQDFLPAKAGIATTFVPISDLDAVAAALTPSTRVIYTETLSNPTLVVADIPALAELAHAKVAQHAQQARSSGCCGLGGAPVAWCAA